MAELSGDGGGNGRVLEATRVVVDGAEPLVFDLTPGEGVAPGAFVQRLPQPRKPVGPARFEVVVEGWRFEATVEPAARAELRERAARLGGGRAAAARQTMRAQIPGRVVTVTVAVGDAVQAGQRLLSIEAMKMENAVLAPRAGTIERVGVTAGQTIELGDELVVIA